MKKRYIYGILAGLGICAAGVLYYYGRAQTQTELPDRTWAQTQDYETAAVQDVPDTESEAAQICVHICGAVMDPGVYQLPAGSRIGDGIAAAGGFAPDADTEYINLALLLEDGMQVRVPTAGEAESMRAAQAEASDGLVDINTAGLEELMTLPGIGEVRAQAIIEYRSRNGPFEDISDIMRVSGIKESAYQQIQYRIKVG